MRLAFFTPLNPQQSGISDYSEELLPSLAEHAEIDIVMGPYEPSSAEIKDRFRVIQTNEFLAHSARYDCAIYQVGNSLQYHGYMIPCLRAVPGIVVLHDYSLMYLILGMTVLRGSVASLESMLRPTHGGKAGRLARRLLTSGLDSYELSLAAPIVEMSSGVIVHSEYARGRLSTDAPAKRIEVIRHATPIRELRDRRRELRARFGFREDDVILASISTVAYNKRVHLLLNGLRVLRKRFPRIKLVMVGNGRLGSDARRLIARHDLGEHVVQTGWVSAQDYLDYIDLADIVTDLRYPSAGETSGSSLRAMQAGKPLVVSAHGSFLEIPDECCVRVPVGAGESEYLVRTLTDLIDDPVKRREMGAAARSYVLAKLRVEQAAESYIRFIRRVIAAPETATVPWEFPEPGGRSLSARSTALAYRLCRMRYVLRHYGLTELFGRLRHELN
ncbi:MAG: glycosyltransferase family 4 protein [Acidobacteriota bacterium]|nr:glycosyltransferase family 4 protein [Acidobacteriota bacterium]